MRTRARKMGLGLGLVVATILAMATPAAAVDYPFNIEQINGFIAVGGVEFPVPGDPIGECPEGDLSIEGEANDDGSLDAFISSSNAFNVPFGGVKYLELSGAGSGSWVDNPPFHFEADFELEFEIRSYDDEECVPGAVECFGTASLSAEGDEILDVGPAGIPPFSSGDQVAVSASGQIDVVDRPGNPGASSCPGLLGFAVYEGASVSVEGDFEQQ